MTYQCLAVDSDGAMYLLESSQLDRFKELDKRIANHVGKIPDELWDAWKEFDKHEISGDISNYTFDNFRRVV